MQPDQTVRWHLTEVPISCNLRNDMGRPSLEEGHSNGQDELGAVASPEDSPPGVLHALQGFMGQHYGVKLHVHILGASHLLQDRLGLGQVAALYKIIWSFWQEQTACIHIRHDDETAKLLCDITAWGGNILKLVAPAWHVHQLH